MAASPEPFVIAIPDAVLHDPQQRLALTRWPDEIPGAGWQYGSNLAYVKELVHYWQHQYDSGIPTRDHPSAARVGGAGVQSAALDTHGRGRALCRL